MIRGYDPGWASRRSERSYYVEIWQQPFVRWLISQVYFKWEKISEPFMKRISHWHRKYFYTSMDYVPLSNRRDVRSHFLRYKNRVCLTIVYVTKAQYDVITGRKPPESTRHEIRSPVVPGSDDT